MDAPPQELDAAYRRYRPLLLGALAYLARRGLRVPFGDGLDLVHDFFLDAYRGLLERYDGQRAAFSTYLYAAFVRYARPRIVRMRRWNAALPIERASVERDESSSSDHAAIQDALSKLSSDDERILQWRFGNDLSEREIASRLGATRYASRQALLRALGRLVVALDDHALADERTLAVARLLWNEDRGYAETAARLGVTVEHVRRASERLLATLARGLAPVKEQ